MFKKNLNNIINYKKFFNYKTPLGLLFTYHTYCGYKTIRKNKNEKLFINIFLLSLLNGSLSIFPYILASLYKDLGRLEIFLRNLDKDHCQYDIYYNEYIEIFL